MYAPFFGLRCEAFSIAPDPHFLYLSAMHREALAHLLYGLGAGGGFVLLTGEIGAGKTTVCRAFLEQIPPGHSVAYLFNPKLSAHELLQTVCQEFGIAHRADDSVKALVDALNRFLLEAHAEGRNCLLVIDEAQSLSAEVLEQLRLLTNLETDERKLLQIVLIGQPELRTMLSHPELEQLAQRVVARVHLGALDEAETADYVRHRLSVAGRSSEIPFDARALALIHRRSGGVPRRINLLCQRALLGAYAGGRMRVGAETVEQAAREVFDDAARPAAWPRRALAAAVLTSVALGAVFVAWRARSPEPAAAVASAASAAAGGGAAVGASAAVAAAPPPSAASAGATQTAASAAAVPAGAGGRLQGFDSADKAWRELAALWSWAVQSDPACLGARSQGLACFEGDGDLALLRKLDRPVLLALDDAGPVVLLGLSEDGAVLGTAAGERLVSLADLQSQWRGRFATLWRTPPGWADDRVAPAGGPTAEWLLARLTALQGEARPAAGQRREELLRQRVFAFQVGQGLALDALAGPLTLMQVNRASSVDEPRLRREP